MLIGVIADDFTGAGDIAVALAKGPSGKGGLSTVQFLGVPTEPAPPEAVAGVVSLKTRSLPPKEAIAQSLAALDWLLAQGAKQIIFKYCSTFDSTARGNIGPVADALAERLGADKVVFCPAFPANGRTVYQGNLFVGDVPLNESGMAHHPLTPMRDADIRRVLKSQSENSVGHIGFQVVHSGSDAVKAAVGSAAEKFLIVDAITDHDLEVIAQSQADAVLVTGGSGIAPGLAGNFVRAGSAEATALPCAAVEGPEILLAGSCSRATLGQIANHSADHPSVAIDIDAVMAGKADAATYLPFVLDNSGKAPLVHSSAAPDKLQAIQDKYGAQVVADKLDGLFAELAVAAVKNGVRRVVVAGGETSGAVAGALGAASLLVGEEIDPGVPVLMTTGQDRIALALKSGNFGAKDFFAKALNSMTRQA